jgi:hypothetical protein
MQEITKQQVLDAVRCSFSRLVKEDGNLFDCPIEEHSCYDARKLHEVCINHRLANYREKEIIPLLKEKIFVDIEFNREGVDFKNVAINGKDKICRPDIIIHNRMTGPEKVNFLVVECKKKGTPEDELKADLEKIHAFMDDARYEYSFGLRVVYGKDGCEGMLFFKSGTKITSEPLNYSLRSIPAGSEDRAG